jgi:hypothetical protein
MTRAQKQVLSRTAFYVLLIIIAFYLIPVLLVFALFDYA